MRKTMPFRLVKTCLLLLALFTLTPLCAAAAESKWVLLDENADTRFYYDGAHTAKSGPGRLGVTVRIVYTEEGKEDALKILGTTPGFDKLLETHYDYDMDCIKRKIRLLTVTHLDDAGNKLKTTDLSSVSPWEEVPPGTRLDLLSDSICPH